MIAATIEVFTASCRIEYQVESGDLEDVGKYNYNTNTEYTCDTGPVTGKVTTSRSKNNPVHINTIASVFCTVGRSKHSRSDDKNVALPRNPARTGPGT